MTRTLRARRDRRGLLTRDGYVLVAARGLRMLSYGFLSVILALYLSAIGFSAVQIGTLFTVALAGGTAAMTVISLLADRWGRRVTLISSSVFMAAAGVALATSTSFPLLLVVAALGTLSPSGQEIGPFQSLEQAALSEASTEPGRAMPYAWYNLVGYLAVAVGALAGRWVKTIVFSNPNRSARRAATRLESAESSSCQRTTDPGGPVPRRSAGGTRRR